jgi:hypothetical protein
MVFDFRGPASVERGWEVTCSHRDFASVAATRSARRCHRVYEAIPVLVRKGKEPRGEGGRTTSPQATVYRFATTLAELSLYFGSA